MKWPWQARPDPPPTIVFAIGAWWGTFASVVATSVLGKLEMPHLPRFVFDAADLGIAAAKQPRWIFFLNWSSHVPNHILSASECVNVHCTPLPYGRGGAPIENMIVRGHDETVITAHQMTSEVDAGDVYLRSAPLSLEGSKEDIQLRFIEPTAALIANIVRHELKPSPQTGEVVPFRRLPQKEYEAFWIARGGHV